MRKLHAALLAAGGAALVAGTAYAAGRLHTMNVALPDGSVAQISYEGDVAPKVAIVPAQAAAQDPFAEMQRMSAMMQARHEAMMRQSAELQQRIQQQVQTQVTAAQQGEAGQYAQTPGQIVVSTNAPAGSYSYSMVSSSSGANGCTQVMEMRSDGSSKEPQVTRTSSGDCSGVQKNAPAAPAAAKPAQGQTRIPAGTI